MSVLYIRLPASWATGHTADHAVQSAALGCSFALAGDAGAIQREGSATLPELAALVAGAQRVVLILAATDVSLLRVAVPPLSPARLRAALPNLVEDQLLDDLSDVVVVAGRSADAMRTVAVVRRDWLEMLTRVMLALGARRIQALPAQLCLPYREAAISAAVSAIDSGTERGNTLVVRLAAQEGLGLPLLPEAGVASAPAALQLLRLVAPEAAVTLYVPAAEVRAYQAAAAEDGQRITIQPDSWAHWIAGAQDAQPDLATGLGSVASPGLDWRRWRWPLLLAGALLLVNTIALNLDWWRLQQEANATRAALTRVFQKAYPQEVVIVDPLLQLRQKIATAKRQAGQPAADDFALLAAGFAEAWSRAGSGGTALPAIGALEYHERALLVRIKTPGEIPLAQLRPALAARHLGVTRQGADALQVRSAP